MPDTPNPFSKLFTLDEASSLVPRLRDKVERLSKAVESVRNEIEELAQREGLDPASPAVAEKLAARPQAVKLVEEVQDLIDEIQSHGCLVNGPEAGLVDFPCLMAGEIVLLCWKADEPGIGHWHRIPDGFAGRRPLLDDGEAAGPVN